MTPDEPPSDDPIPATGTHISRLQMLTDVLLFQFKLVIDGLRDLLLSPLSIVAAVAGLIAGGEHPDRYFRKVIRFGRRTEVWINLFGEHGGPGTADHLVDPLRARVMDEARENAWLSRAGTSLNKRLDGVNAAFAAKDPRSGDPGGTDQPDVNSEIRREPD